MCAVLVIVMNERRSNEDFDVMAVSTGNGNVSQTEAAARDAGHPCMRL